jgi:hypothetical protein
MNVCRAVVKRLVPLRGTAAKWNVGYKDVGTCGGVVVRAASFSFVYVLRDGVVGHGSRQPSGDHKIPPQFDFAASE